MALNLSKLTEAVTAVAGIAQMHAQLKADVEQAQKDVDTLTASLIAATTDPAGAVGLAAVSEALAAPEASPAPVADVLASLK